MKVWILKEALGFTFVDFEYEVPPDPMEDGKFLLPAISYTELVPPVAKENELAVLEGFGTSNEKWKLIPNFIGTRYWLEDGTSLVVENLGEALPEGALTEPPLPKATKITAAQFRQQLILDGKDEAVAPAIAAISDPIKRKLILARYEFESFFKIDDPDLLLMAGAIGYNTPEEIQEFFTKASSIQ